MSKAFDNLLVPVNGNLGSRDRTGGKRSIARLLGFLGKDAVAYRSAAVAPAPTAAALPHRFGPFSGKIRFKTR